ncbi:hypothetical protein HDU84_006515 [Entophlyctis sp. JEL0112]|nr:hypothetical protein HDU84_006515 [Entophlyctis sp. JEL0112]
MLPLRPPPLGSDPVAPVGLVHAHAARADVTSFPPAGYRETLQVAPPVSVPTGLDPVCSVSLGWYHFANSYGQPWVTTDFSLPSHCGSDFSAIILTLQSSVAGLQFDRVYQVWFDGAEALRGCTDEPIKAGIWWQIDKDVTDFAPIIKKASTVIVGLDNINDSTYTGVYNTSVSLTFYPATSKHPVPPTVPDVLIPLYAPGTYPYVTLDGSGKAANFHASGIPKNIKKAEIEYFVSHHSNDEFYYVNVPDSLAQPDEGLYGSGTFKELQVYVDGQQIGVDWPFQLIYTGGFDPSLWSPIVHASSENFPSYRFDVTPFAFLFADGGNHTFTLNVTTQTAGSLWYVDANLRIWLDESGKQTQGKIVHVDFPSTEPTYDIVMDADGVDFSVKTTFEKAITFETHVNNYDAFVKQSLQFESYVNYTADLFNVWGYHNIKATTEVQYRDPIFDVILSATTTTVDYPFFFNVTFTYLDDAGTLFYEYVGIDHSRNIEVLTTSVTPSVEKVRERHFCKGYYANSVPPGYWNENMHNVVYESEKIALGVWDTYSRNVTAVNATITDYKVSSLLF